MTRTLDDCEALDRADPLRPLRELFALPGGTIYLDGNSLGALPKATPSRVAQTVQQQWGEGLIGSWNSAGWFELPGRVGDRIAPLVGAARGELVATDSTSVNLFKALSAALSISKHQGPVRRALVAEKNDFPTDRYIAEALCAQHGLELRLVEPDGIEAALDERAAVLLLTHVNYRSGALHDMARLNEAAHAAGALTVWDLAHSAGAVPVQLNGCDADFAVGCGYKFLNGGPGAPAFVWAHARHADRCAQPLSGWWGHATPFEFAGRYRPAAGSARFLCGTQPILSLAALDSALDVFDACAPLGGIAALREKSLALGDLFIELVESRCAGHGLALVTPRAHARRGSQLSFARTDPDSAQGPSGAYPIMQALIKRGVIGDFRAGDAATRAPDILRFGLTPLYLGFADVWHAVEQLREVLGSGEWRRAEFSRQGTVT